jgi:uncharacterized protein YndB with AHSA1/START domain
MEPPNMPNKRVNPNPSEVDFTLKRVIEAPRSRVFAAFTTVEHLSKWWGPKGFTIHAKQHSFRPSGEFHYSMQAPSGDLTWGKFVYREIVATERIVFVNSFADENGNVVHPPFEERWPAEMLTTLEFADHPRGTLLTVIVQPLDATDEERGNFARGHDSMRQGFGGTWDQLVEHLARS